MTTFTVTLPAHALDALNKMLSEIAVGNALEIMPLHAELTTQEAANFLNVSRPYLVKLLKDGKLPRTHSPFSRRPSRSHSCPFLAFFPS